MGNQGKMAWKFKGLFGNSKLNNPFYIETLRPLLEKKSYKTAKMLQ